MSIRREITEYEGVYFITFTCTRWFRLFEITNGYDAVYKWFDYLKSKGHYILGYVTMPNHVHALLAFRNTQGQSINSILGNGKRFMAYDLISRLEDQKNQEVLTQLTSFVNPTEKRRGKLHEVFEPSFDWKECLSQKFMEQKLDYIHNNACAGVWHLAEHPWEYIHSSAQFYFNGTHSAYEVTSYAELEDIDLTKPW
jgi:REP element-mobilizing transposase RayT